MKSIARSLGSVPSVAAAARRDALIQARDAKQQLQQQQQRQQHRHHSRPGGEGQAASSSSSSSSSLSASASLLPPRDVQHRTTRSPKAARLKPVISLARSTAVWRSVGAWSTWGGCVADVRLPDFNEASVLVPLLLLLLLCNTTCVWRAHSTVALTCMCLHALCFGFVSFFFSVLWFALQFHTKTGRQPNACATREVLAHPEPRDRRPHPEHTPATRNQTWLRVPHHHHHHRHRHHHHRHHPRCTNPTWTAPVCQLLVLRL